MAEIDAGRIAADTNGYVYVTDWENNRVQKFTANGSYITEWSGTGSGDGQFNRPAGIDIDASGNVYVVDVNNHRVQKFKQGALPRADFNGDCAVNMIDWAYFAGYWLWHGNPFDR